MFVFNRNLLTITKYTKNLYANIGLLNKYGMNVFQQKVDVNIFQQKVSIQQLSTVPSSDTTDILNQENTVNIQNSSGLINEQNTSRESHSIDYGAITKGNKELEHKLKVIMLEAEVLRQEGHLVPPHDYINPEMWESLLNLTSRSSRKKYLEYLFKNSKKKEYRLLKKHEKRKANEEMREAHPPDGQKSLPIEELASQYRLCRNTIFLRVHDSTMNRFYNNRLVQAMQFGPKIVIDCGYDENMTRRENYNCAKQLMLLFAENRNNDQPFDIHYTNINKESDLIKMLQKYIPTLYDLEFPMNTHEKSYLDLFPKNNLVYLTPHSREEMEQYDYDAVYVIGAIVDKVNNEPLSLAKAKREGIKMQKFPLDRYLQWGSGSGKSLTLNQCVAILLDVKETGDWSHALRHVPKRKLADLSMNQNFGKPRDDHRYDFNRDRSWRPKYYKKPSYMKD